MQMVHFDTVSSIPPDKYPFVLNNLLPADIRVQASREVPAGFHARFLTSGKTYTYRILNNRHGSALLRATRWHVPVPLDFPSMREALSFLPGTHDFAAFQAAGGTARTTLRTIDRAELSSRDAEITLTVSGNAFLYNMVRIIAGTLSEIGTGKRPPSCIREAVETGSRLCLGMTAPACGLMLERVLYEGDEGVIPELFDPEQSGVYYSGSGKE